MRLPFCWFNVSQLMTFSVTRVTTRKTENIRGNHDDKKGQTIYFYLIRVLILSNIYLEDLFRKVGCCYCYGHQRDGHTDVVNRLWWVEPPMNQRWRGLLTEGRCPHLAETRYLGTSFSFLFPSNVSWQNGYTLFPISNSKAKNGKISTYIFTMSQTFKWF